MGYILGGTLNDGADNPDEGGHHQTLAASEVVGNETSSNRTGE
jgi:hypothetical protein